MTWCTSKHVTLKVQHIPGRLNVVADRLFRLDQTIQTEWSLLPEVFQAICNRCYLTSNRPFCDEVQQQTIQICVTSAKPPGLGSQCTPAMEDLDPYAFPPAAILGKGVQKLQDYPCKRIFLISPGWPTMPWFIDLVAMSNQIPLSLPNLPTQPFNQTLHMNQSNLNLHALVLEPQGAGLL